MKIGRDNITGANRFHVAVQALVRLAGSEGTCSSAAMAEGCRTHAVLLRRVLAQLVRANIVEAREGRAGGYRLARPAERIGLDEIARAIRLPEATQDQDPAVKADEGSYGGPRAGVEAALAMIEDEAAQRVFEVLAGYTLADVIVLGDRVGLP
jgi:Rrf2 family protein